MAGKTTFLRLTALCLATSALTGANAAVINYTAGSDRTTPIVLTDNSTQLQVLTGSATQSGVISENGGSFSLAKTGSGTLIFTAANTYTGFTFDNAGILQIGNGGTSGSIAGNIDIAGGLLTFNRSDTYTYGGVISGPGASSGSTLTVASGTVVLTGTNTYIGVTTINSGTTLQVGTGGTSGAIYVPSGSGHTTSGTIVNSGSLVFDRSDTVTMDEIVAITGTGSLTQAGSGTLILAGTYSYTGGTTISAGTLQIGEGDGVLGFAGYIVNNSALTFNLNNRNPVISGDISGTGSVTINGGSTILAGNNSYTGGTTVINALLTIGNGGNTGSIPGNITFVNNSSSGIANNVVIFNRSGTYTYGGVISGPGGVTLLSSGGTIILTGNNSYTNNTSVDVGILQIGNGGTTGSVGSGEILESGGLLIFNRSDTVTLNNSINSTGDIHQRGPGNLILTARNSLITGRTFVDGGTLTVNGSIAPSAVTVQPGGTLSGNGAVGTTIVNSGGTLAPATAAIGSLTIGGNLTLAPGSSTQVLVTPTSASAVGVNGAASLAGTLLLNFQGGTYTPMRYTLITASGPLTGTFSSISNSGASAGLLASVTYDANNAYLNLSGAASDTLIHAGLRSAALQGERLIQDAVLNRLAADGDGVWSEGFTAYGEMGEKSLHHGHSGIIGGVDFTLAEGLRAGIAGAYTGDSLSQPADASNASSTTRHLIAYANYSSSPWRVALGGEFGWGSADVVRIIASAPETDSSRRDIGTTQAFGEVSYGLQADDVAFEPHAGIQWLQATAGAFQETGGVFAVSGPQASNAFAYSDIGVRAAMKNLDLDGFNVAPHMGVSWRHAFGVLLPSQIINASFGQTTVLGVGPDRDAMAMQIAVDVRIGRDASLTLGYDGLAAPGERDQALTGRLDWRL